MADGLSSTVLPLSNVRCSMVITNFFRPALTPGRNLHLYTLSFDPVINADSRKLRYSLLAQAEPQLKVQLGVHALSGALVFATEKCTDLTLQVQLPQYKVVLTYHHSIDSSNSTPEMYTVLNVLLKQALRSLGFKQITRLPHYFDKSQTQTLPELGLEVWKGYSVQLNRYGSDSLLSVDFVSKVVHTRSVLDDLAEWRGRGGEWELQANSNLCGRTIMAKYGNRRCYRVDEVVFSKTPRDRLSEAEATTFVEYYERNYAEHIRYPTQPLLRCHMKRKSGEDDIFLIPELVVLTGLDQEMRTNYKTMQQLASATRLTPAERLEASSALPALLVSEQEAHAVLANFDLGFVVKPLEVPAQDLSGECVFTDAHSSCPVDDRGNFQLSGRKVLTSVALEEWVVVAPEAEKEASKDFVLALVRSLAEMNSATEQPRVHLYGNGMTVESAVRQLMETSEPRFLLVLLPRRLKDRYAPIKKLTSTEHCVPSQFVVVPVPEKRFRGVVDKVALQIQAKLGAQLWTVRPCTDFGKYVMVVGIDIYHDLVSRRQSVMGFCATVHPNFSKYYSTAALQASGQEIVSAIGQCFTEALLVFREKARKLPETVIIFRDGVGESQISGVTGFEVASLQRACQSVDPDYSPKLSYIVVIKKPSAKFFAPGSRGVLSPKPGTLITTQVVPCSGDFYLISHTAHQGISTPTLYRTVQGSENIESLARLAYKLCHMYYNWQGAVKVPAPVMMAHRLAYFVGQWVHEPVAPSIRSFSFYL